LKAERDLTAIANREVIRARFLLSELRDSYDIVKQAKQSSDAEAKRMIADLQSRVLILEEENVDLKKRLSRDARLRRV
jgi:predicted nucleotidyltransferase component of viral defense system